MTIIPCIGAQEAYPRVVVRGFCEGLVDGPRDIATGIQKIAKGARQFACQVEQEVQRACQQRPYQVAAAGIAIAADLACVQHGRGDRGGRGTSCRRH
ncbi:hypothetical protein ABBQ32_006298 [Trebouxia sp. C0010 RCD-2024]